jgi:hypothetical protein
MSNRHADGRRINAKVARGDLAREDRWGGKFESIGNRASNGKRKHKKPRTKMDVTAGHDADGNTSRADGRPMPKVANPGNVLTFEDGLVVKARVGGGHMGSPLCHAGEAPYPENLPEFFILAYSPPQGIVCDPF